MRILIKGLTAACVSFIVFGLVFAGISLAEIDEATIMGLWLFDEGEGDEAKDASGNGNDGTLMNGAKWDDGKFGKAVDLDGVDDYVEVPDAPNLGSMEEVTVAAWMFLHVFNTGGYTGIADKTAGGNPGQRSYNIGQRSGQLEWGVVNDANTKNTLNTGATKTEEWVHLAGTYDGSEMKLYENGVQIGTLAQAGPVYDSDTVLAIGRWNGGGGSLYAEGLIDEVVIFNVALSEDDINTIMTQGFAMVLAVEHTDKLTSTWATVKTQY